MTDFPLPGSAPAVVAVAAPGEGPGFWAGAPCAAFDDDGSVLLAYRVRNGHDGNDETVVARSDDGERRERRRRLVHDRGGIAAEEAPDELAQTVAIVVDAHLEDDVTPVGCSGGDERDSGHGECFRE